MSEINRRDFVIATASTAAATALCIAAPATAAPPKAQAGGTVDLGPVSAFNKDGFFDKHAAKPTLLMVVRTGTHAEGRLLVIETGTACELGQEHGRPVVRAWNVPARAWA